MQCYSFLSNYYARLFEVKKNRGILRIKNRNDGSSFLCSTDFQINRHTHKHTQTLTRPWTLYVFIRTNVFRDEEVSIYRVSYNYCPIRCSNSNTLIGQELWDTLYINDRFSYSPTSFHHGWQQHSLVGLLAGLSWQNIFNKTFLQYAFTLYVCRR